ncbi:MAG: hypothetical protein Q7J76_10405 [Candidatus Brocadiaceae bacterium]|uniref:hypothetical protein n=1 Tax=Candidatus Wunengus sp. YC61 TaxID=3367698 RepID=UPI00271B33D3|nr:hypothetical protein [Candidatus Brocadiaceae bacterium]
MEWLYNLSNSTEFWVVLGTLGGTIVGFVLNEATRSTRDWQERLRLKKALKDELDTNFYLIEDKKDILKKMIEALRKKKVLPGMSVSCAKAIYSSHFSVIVKHLKPIERDLVQNVYARFEIHDRFMENFEELFKGDMHEKVVEDVWTAYANKLEGILASYEVAQELIASFLEGKPFDVCQREKKTPLRNQIFAGKVTPDIVRQQRGA